MLLIPLQTHLHDTVTQTVRLRISMVTPLLSPGDRVTHSGELIRAVVTSAIPPLGAFEDDTVRVCMCVCIFHACLICVGKSVLQEVRVCVGIIRYCGSALYS